MRKTELLVYLQLSYQTIIFKYYINIVKKLMIIILIDWDYNIKDCKILPRPEKRPIMSIFNSKKLSNI